jgi:hypothetical protein
MRFGYNDKNSETATIGGENLSSILGRDGIAAKDKVPVTVYLKGMLTRPDLSGYSSCIEGKRPSKPKRKAV